MRTVSSRDLQRHLGAVLDEVTRTGRPSVVTRHGRPIAVLMALDEEAFQEWALENAPAFVRTAGRQYGRGKTGTLAEFRPRRRRYEASQQGVASGSAAPGEAAATGGRTRSKASTAVARSERRRPGTGADALTQDT